jgi:hypothetical protein
MTVVILLALGWLGLRSLMVLAQVARHGHEARLARSFAQGSCASGDCTVTVVA